MIYNPFLEGTKATQRVIQAIPKASKQMADWFAKNLGPEHTMLDVMYDIEAHVEEIINNAAHPCLNKTSDTITIWDIDGCLVDPVEMGDDEQINQNRIKEAAIRTEFCAKIFSQFNPERDIIITGRKKSVFSDNTKQIYLEALHNEEQVEVALLRTIWFPENLTPNDEYYEWKTGVIQEFVLSLTALKLCPKTVQIYDDDLKIIDFCLTFLNFCTFTVDAFLVRQGGILQTTVLPHLVPVEIKPRVAKIKHHPNKGTPPIDLENFQHSIIRWYGKNLLEEFRNVDYCNLLKEGFDYICYNQTAKRWEYIRFIIATFSKPFSTYYISFEGAVKAARTRNLNHENAVVRLDVYNFADQLIYKTIIDDDAVKERVAPKDWLYRQIKITPQIMGVNTLKLN